MALQIDFKNILLLVVIQNKMEPGSDIIRTYFCQKDDMVMINHGSYGLSPQPVLQRRFELLEEQEQQPDVWFRENLDKYYQESISVAAQFVGADPNDLFIVNNATTGINFILKSLEWNAEDEILLTSHSYLAVKNTAEYITEKFNVKVCAIDITFPIDSEDDIVELYKKILAERPNIKLAIVDHITSCSAIRMPVKKIISLCREHGVVSVIDGAHAPGQVRLNMRDIDCDFYVGNFHKWFYTCRHCAFMYVTSWRRGSVRPLVTSNFVDQPLARQFAYAGTLDNSSFFTLQAASRFYGDLGGTEAITAYNDNLVTWAQEMIAESLNTRPLAVPKSMRAPNMAVVELPPAPERCRSSISANDLTEMFWSKYRVQTCFTHFDDRIWLRLSCNVYNRRRDYLRLRDVLRDFYFRC